MSHKEGWLNNRWGMHAANDGRHGSFRQLACEKVPTGATKNMTRGHEIDISKDTDKVVRPSQ